MLKTVTIFGPSTGVKLEHVTPGILRNTPVTRNTVNLTPKTVTPPDSNLQPSLEECAHKHLKSSEERYEKALATKKLT